MTKASALPAAIFVSALPQATTAQSVRPPPPPAYAVPMPPPPPRPLNIAPPAPPMPTYVTQPQPIESPANWFTADDYPAAAKRAGEQGRVSIRLMVGANGLPAGCAVTGSSGSQVLDDATCRLALRRGRFVPPRNASGNPVPFYFPLSMRWELQDTDDLDFDLDGARVDIAKGPWNKTLVSAVIDIDEQGRGVACRSGTRAVSTAIACEGFFADREMMDPVLSGGKPVRATITLSRSIRVGPKPPAK